MTQDPHHWAGIKQAYVHGDWSLGRIGDAYDVSAYRIRAQAKKDGWKRLVGTKPLRRPSGATKGTPAKVDDRRRDMVRRLLDALDKKLMQLEARMAPDAEPGGEPQSAADIERDARTLSGLARLYAKLVELDASAQGAGGDNKEGAVRPEATEDAEHFRRDLALRLQRLNQGRRS
jgi:hypothetical protein